MSCEDSTQVAVTWVTEMSMLKEAFLPAAESRSDLSRTLLLLLSFAFICMCKEASTEQKDVYLVFYQDHPLQNLAPERCNILFLASLRVRKRASLVAQMVKNPPATPGLGRSSRGGYRNLLQYSSLENPQVGCSPWGCKG